MDQIGQQTEKRDISKQTLIVLVVLAIVVSLLGTLTVVRETSGMHKVINLQEQGASTQTSQGRVSLTIVDSNGNSGANAVENSATGYVTFELVSK